MSDHRIGTMFPEESMLPRMISQTDGDFIAVSRDILEELAGQAGPEVDGLITREIDRGDAPPICLLSPDSYGMLLDRTQVVATDLSGTDLLEGY